MFLSEWHEFPPAPCLAGGGGLDDSSHIDVVDITHVPDMTKLLWFLITTTHSHLHLKWWLVNVYHTSNNAPILGPIPVTVLLARHLLWPSATWSDYTYTLFFPAWLSFLDCVTLQMVQKHYKLPAQWCSTMSPKTWIFIMIGLYINLKIYGPMQIAADL